MAAARVRTNRFLLKWGWVQPTQGSFRWGPTDRFIGRLAIQRNPGGPGRVGKPGLAGGLGLDSPDRWAGGREGVAELPQGAGGALRAGRQLLGHRVPPAIRSGRQAAADPVLADLERAQSEEVLRAGPSRPASTRGWCRSPTTRSRAEHPQARIVLAGLSGNGDMHRLGLPQQLLRGVRDQEQVRRRRPAPVRAHPRPASALAIQRVRTVMKNRGDAATPLWLTELAWGSAPPDGFGLNKGLTGQAQMLTSSYNMILQKPHRLERAAPLLVPLARSPRRQCVVQLLRHRGAVELQPHPEARLRQVQELHGRDDPAPGDDHRGRPERHQGHRRRPSPSPRTSPARPSSAGSTEAPTSPAARRTRPRRSPTATTPSSSGRSTPPETRASSSGGASPSTPSAPPAPPDHRHRPQLAGQRQRPRAEGLRRGGLDGEALQDGGLHGCPRGPGLGRQVRLARHHRLGPRQHDHGLPRQGDRRRRQRLALLGPFTYVEDSTP